MVKTSSQRDVLRTKLSGIKQAAGRGKNEFGSLLPDDVTELLAMVAEGDAAVAFVRQVVANAYTANHVKVIDDARALAATLPSA